MTKQETLPKGIGVAKFDFTKTFRNQLFSRVRILYHQDSITNHSESILKSKIMSILMIILLLFLSDLSRNILNCNCIPYSTLVIMYLPSVILCSNVLNSSMRKVHLVKGHVKIVYVYWIDTVFVQNNLPTEFSIRTIFIILKLHSL